MTVSDVFSCAFDPALFDDSAAESEYVFNAAQPQKAKSRPRARAPDACRVEIIPGDGNAVQLHIRTVIEAPSPSVAAAFLARAVTPPAPPSAKARPATGVSSRAPLARVNPDYGNDLVPYMLHEYELSGIAINAHPVSNASPPTPATSMPPFVVVLPPGFEESAVPFLQKQRPRLVNVPQGQIRVEMRPIAHTLHLACLARLTAGRSLLSLFELMYDDAFVHGLMNWQQQPSKTLVSFMRWLFLEVSHVHQVVKKAHGSLGLHAISFSHITSCWHLQVPEQWKALKEDEKEDLLQLARIVCFMSEPRRTHQPHLMAQLTDEQLLELTETIPDVRLLAQALFAGRCTISDALSCHLWHTHGVHAQVLQYAKTIMRSTRLGGEDFDRSYHRIVLKDLDWKEVLGPKLVPAIVLASRQHVHRADFETYSFTSAASLLRFTANTIKHYENLDMGLKMSQAAFLETVLTAFPALIAASYHYLACSKSADAQNRDTMLVFESIEEGSDETHQCLRSALQGFIESKVWRLEDLVGFDQAEEEEQDPEAEKLAQLAKEWSAWKCQEPTECSGFKDGSCTKWHEVRELKFAKDHVCKDFIEGFCHKPSCPRAHGFGEIRSALNDSSRICWRWLESGSCNVEKCRYVHTFSRQHGASARNSMDTGGRNSFSHGRPSMDDSFKDARRRQSFSISRPSLELPTAVGASAVSAEVKDTNGVTRNGSKYVNGGSNGVSAPVNHPAGPVALDSILTAPSKLGSKLNGVRASDAGHWGRPSADAPENKAKEQPTAWDAPASVRAHSRGPKDVRSRQERPVRSWMAPPTKAVEKAADRVPEKTWAEKGRGHRQAAHSQGSGTPRDSVSNGVQAVREWGPSYVNGSGAGLERDATASGAADKAAAVQDEDDGWRTVGPRKRGGHNRHRQRRNIPVLERSG